MFNTLSGKALTSRFAGGAVSAFGADHSLRGVALRSVVVEGSDPLNPPSAASVIFSMRISAFLGSSQRFFSASPGW